MTANPEIYVVYWPPHCPVCGVQARIEVEAGALARWQGGELAQHAFPYMDREDRETLKSGTHGSCWERLFRDPDDDDDERYE
ncbi:MAG: hypothetical protein FJ038_11670 [Chloroflexi bacterium]|nr:hypothetical protein [Chloroflexota bacterium]